jgi:DNA polymerase-1
LVATGRLSSFEPNLQNIPAGKGYGIQIRSAFVTPRSKMFVAADYSQIDLRALAHLSKDKHLIDAFLHDKDIHALTASQVFDIPLSQVKRDQRQIGKRINFGIIYGLTPFGLSKDLGIKPSEAKEYIEKYFTEYKGVKKFIEKTVDFAKEHGYTKTWMGRRRYVPHIHEQNRTLFEAAKRVAVNSPVQGTSSEIMKLAMIEIEKQLELKKLEAKMVLQIHDEIILELPQKEQKIVEKLVKTSMINVVKWEIPLKVGICTGKRWDQVTK